MDNIKDTFTITTDSGERIVCYILFTFESEETSRHYVVYTDKIRDENGSFPVYASAYDPEKPCLEPVETEQEWAMIEGILKSTRQEDVDALRSN